MSARYHFNEDSMSVFTNPASGSKEHGRAYTAAVLGLVGDADPMAILRRTEPALRAAIAGLSPEQLRLPERPGKWSVAQVVQHLADSELVWGWRLRLVLAQERPAIIGYDQDLWAERLRYDLADAEEALAEFAVLRAANLRLLDRATEADLARYGVHAERGEESVAHMMKLYAGHDTLHLNQIERIKSATG